MQYLELTLAEPESNLALDEALLEAAESNRFSGVRPGEVLRVWEPLGPCVVLGRSSQVAREVRREQCQADGIPVFRRVSGGATIVTGPGCLMYAAVLSYQRDPELRLLDRAHRYVMERMQQALVRLGLACRIEGTSDLTWQGRKCSGNSLRCRRYGLLYHGTLLYDFPLAQLERYLGIPARQPDYRADRSHGDFVTNLPVAREPLIAALRSAWGAEEVMPDWPVELTARLAQEKYQRLEWTERH